MNITFSSRGRNYTAAPNDIFMNNGIVIVHIKDGKYSSPNDARRPLSPKEWARIEPMLKKIDYEEYYGFKPLLPGVNIYQLKN